MRHGSKLHTVAPAGCRSHVARLAAIVSSCLVVRVSDAVRDTIRVRNSATQRSDLAPQIVFLPVQGLEIASGHRFGNLRDPDFAVNGGPGWFLTMGVRFTEKLLPTAGDFWRDRFGQR